MFSSPLTAWAGVAIGLLTLLDQFFKENPVPQTKEEAASFLIKIVTGVAVFLAKDFNKTNAVQANPLPATAPTVPAIMPDLSKGEPPVKPILSLLLISSAFALSACSSLPGFLGGSKNTIEALIDAHSVGTYQATITKNGLVLLQRTYTCVATDATLPKCDEVKVTPLVPSK